MSSTLCQLSQCIPGWDFSTSNGLQLLYKDGNDAYFLEGIHGSTPLVPYDHLDIISPDASCLQHKAKIHSLSAVTLLARSMNRGPAPVSLYSSICIPGRSEVIVKCQLPKSSQDQLGMISPFSATESFSIPSHILSAYSVCQANSRRVPVRLMNTSNFDIELHAGQKVSEFCPLVEVPVL